MAIYSAVPPPAQVADTAVTPNQPTLNTTSTGVDIESWSATAISSLNISSASGVTLSIPLDAERENASKRDPRASPSKPRKELMRRDSQKKRDALLKGKEGSRRRQRWENDHLLHVPNAQPPLPTDWQVHSTSPIRNVPYFLAPLWDAGVRSRVEEIATAKKIATAKRAGVSPTDTKGRVPQELRQKLKKSKGAKTLLQDLEEEIRKFVRDYERKERQRMNKTEEDEPELDTDDEEIVFVGRDGTMSDEQRKNIEVELQKEKMVFDSLVGDQSAGFGRWLVHSIASYYGLTSRSVTVGNPARREAWIGIRVMKTGREKMGTSESDLPRPLWGMI